MTMDNQPSVIDRDTFSVRRTIRISAPVEKVWATVTEPEHISKWFGRAEFNGTGAGALGTLTWDDHGYYEVALDKGTLTLSAQ